MMNWFEIIIGFSLGLSFGCLVVIPYYWASFMLKIHNDVNYKQIKHEYKVIENFYKELDAKTLELISYANLCREHNEMGGLNVEKMREMINRNAAILAEIDRMKNDSY